MLGEYGAHAQKAIATPARLPVRKAYCAPAALWLNQSPMRSRTIAGVTALLLATRLCTVAGALGQFEGETDVGDPKLPGSCQYEPSRQDYTISGAGTNMWFTSDQFHFVWRKLKNDFLLRA